MQSPSDRAEQGRDVVWEYGNWGWCPTEGIVRELRESKASEVLLVLQFWTKPRTDREETPLECMQGAARIVHSLRCTTAPLFEKALAVLTYEGALTKEQVHVVGSPKDTALFVEKLEGQKEENVFWGKCGLKDVHYTSLTPKILPFRPETRAAKKRSIGVTL